MYAWNDVVCAYISINASVITKNLDQYILSLSVGKILQNTQASNTFKQRCIAVSWYLLHDTLVLLACIVPSLHCHHHIFLIIAQRYNYHTYVHIIHVSLTAFRLPFKFGRIGTRAQWYWDLFISISNKQFITIYQYIVLTTVVLRTD